MQSVTAIIPVFNRPDTLVEAANAVMNQTYRPIELIIVNDGSTDSTPAVCERLRERHANEIKVIHQENSGPGAARNCGLRIAGGEFIQYLDSDDLIEPTKFEKQVAALHTNPHADVAYCGTLRRDPVSGQMQPWARTADEITDIFPSFLMKRGWDTNSPLWRRGVCESAGGWSNLRVMEDWEHDLRIGLRGATIVRVDEPLAVVRDHAGNRASGMREGFTPELTRDFFRAHRTIWTAMKAAGKTEWSYLESFARKLFWIARLCGERGLETEAEQALDYAAEMVATHHKPRETQMFRLATRIFGWRTTVVVAERFRRLLKKRIAA